MTIQQIVAIALRLFAIWLVLVAIQLCAITVTINKKLGIDSAALLYLMPAVPVLLAVFVWRFPMFLARRLLPRGLEAGAPRMAPRDVIIAACVIIGLWAIIGSLPRLVGAFGLLLVVGRPLQDNIASLAFYLGTKVDALAALVQCLLGLYLVTKPWAVARLALRAAGSDPEQPATPADQP